MDLESLNKDLQINIIRSCRDMLDARLVCRGWMKTFAQMVETDRKEDWRGRSRYICPKSCGFSCINQKEILAMGKLDFDLILPDKVVFYCPLHRYNAFREFQQRGMRLGAFPLRSSDVPPMFDTEDGPEGISVPRSAGGTSRGWVLAVFEDRVRTAFWQGCNALRKDLPFDLFVQHNPGVLQSLVLSPYTSWSVRNRWQELLERVGTN